MTENKKSCRINSNDIIIKKWVISRWGIVSEFLPSIFCLRIKDVVAQKRILTRSIQLRKDLLFWWWILWILRISPVCGIIILVSSTHFICQGVQDTENILFGKNICQNNSSETCSSPPAPNLVHYNILVTGMQKWNSVPFPF